MKKLVNGLLYSLLIAVAAAGMFGVAQFIVQEQGRVEEEDRQRRLALEERAREEAARAQQEAEQEPEDYCVVYVKELPIYEKKKITKINAGSTQMLSCGDKITVLEEDGLYTKIRTEQDSVGYVWSDCIGMLSDRQELFDSKSKTEPKVVALDINLSGQDASEQAQEADALCFTLAAALEKRLEENGFETVLTARAGEGISSEAKRIELANQIQADVLLQLDLGSSDPAQSAAAYCTAADSQYPAAAHFPYSNKLGKRILKYYTKQTGFADGGVIPSSDAAGRNESRMPAVMLKLGNLSDRGQYEKMKKERFQAKMVKGIADGVAAYFQAVDR